MPLPAVAQLNQPTKPAIYQCGASNHCSVVCLVDDEKVVNTGAMKTFTVQFLARNNYMVQLVEDNGHSQIAYLVGTKLTCSIEGAQQKGD